MFSPTSHSHSLRPKRTRQPGSDDSLKLPQAKRKRSALRRDTFEPLAEASLNEIAGRKDGQTSMNGHSAKDEQPPTAFGGPSRELTVRGGKKPDKRAERSNGTLTLSSNDFYSVTQLPALPDQIRNRPAVPYTCTISPEYGYALALTHTDALVWTYHSSASSPSSRDIFSFQLPFPPSSSSDPLPLASFTAKSAAGEPGIVAVSPKWGKIVYWETITNASSFVPGQTSSGVQGSIPGLLNGEIIKEISSAEPAGFILASSHGRVAHLTIRDQMGRPGIGLQFLRKPSPGPVGSFFGSIRNVFGGDRRRGTPIVRPGRSSKGQRDVVVIAEDGELEYWNTNLGVGNSLTIAINIKDDILDALRHNLPDRAIDMHFKLLDFELTGDPNTSQEIIRHGEQRATSLTVLAALSHRDQTAYYIVEMAIVGSSCSVKVVHPVKCYTEPLSASGSWRPKLLISKSSELAFVVFDTAIVIFSMARIADSPSSQLLMERQALPDPFQDCVKFQEDTIYHMLGLGLEESERADRQSACVLAVQGFGIVRVASSTEPRTADDEDEGIEFRISPKSKIEQAVFFGTLRQNPLDLMSSTAGQSFTTEEVSTAALEISSEILSSSSKYLPKSTPSVDMQMRLRAKALEDLAHYLLKHYSASLSRATRFQLLQNAERLASAQAIWKVQEEIQRHYPGLQDREMPYMSFVLRALHESRQTYPEAAKGESDRVRHWLINDPGKVGHFVTELVSCLEELAPMDVNDPKVVLDYLREAVDIWIAAYNAAFRFREDNAPIYGLGDEVFNDGILAGGYPEGLEHVWTSDSEPFVFGERFISDICKFLREWWDFDPARTKKKKMPTNEEGKPYEPPSKKSMVDLAQRLPVQVELFTRMLEEEEIYAQQQAKQQEDDPTMQKKVLETLRAEKRPRVRKVVTEISRFNMTGSIKLAEKLRDPGLLVSLNSSYITELVKEQLKVVATNSAEAVKLQQQIDAVQDHAETYFETFGNGWAFAHFSRNVMDGDLSAMLAEAQANDGAKQHYLSWYLKKCDKLNFPVGKISWISEVVGERKYHRAEKTLQNVANQEEDDLWGKRTEICLAKLAGLAASEESEARGEQGLTTLKSHAASYDNALTLLDIQESLYAHVGPATAQTIDTQAAQDVVSDTFGVRVTEKTPALQRLLKKSLDALVDKQVLAPQQLVDVLTLMDPVEFPGADEDEDPGVLGHEFALALKVLDVASGLERDEADALRRIIWRRAMIRDDWIKLNETSLKDDAQVEREMQMSALFGVLVQRFLDQDHDGSGVGVKMCSPMDILHAEVLPVSIRRRLDDAEVDRVHDDLNVEQERLREFVEKGRLDMHFGGLVKTAEGVARGEKDRIGEQRAEDVLGGELSAEMDVDEMAEGAGVANGLH